VAARRLGPAAIGDADEAVRTALGDPVGGAGAVLRFCSPGPGKLVVAERGGRAALILASSPGFRDAHGLGPGAPARALRRARTAARLGGTRVVSAGGVLYGIRGSAVRFVAVYDRTAYRTSKRLAAALRLTR
jgi:hypothetical protein